MEEEKKIKQIRDLEEKPMSCSVAIASSPVFSPETRPSRSRFQRAAISLLAGAAASPSVVAVDPSPPLPPPALESSGSRSVLKRKRPARIDIPSAEALPFKTEAVDGRREVAAESARYSVYCKKGRKRLEMEDRHKVSLDINGDPKLVGALQELYWWWF